MANSEITVGSIVEVPKLYNCPSMLVVSVENESARCIWLSPDEQQINDITLPITVLSTLNRGE